MRYDKLRERLKRYTRKAITTALDPDFAEAVGEAADALEKIPPDAQWVYGTDVPSELRAKKPYYFMGDIKYCSACWVDAYWDTDYGQQLFDYCPNCGARMGGEA